MQSRFAGRIGQRFHASVINVAPAVKHHFAHTLGLGAFRDGLAQSLRRRHVAAGLPVFLFTFGGTRRNQRGAVQVIDDLSGQTLVSASTAEGKKEDRKTGGNVASAKSVGKAIAERAKAKGVTKVVFDRGGYLYHGRVKALAEAAREAGLQF